MWTVSTLGYAAGVSTRGATTTATCGPRSCETGLAMARESGPDGVALREVARRVGVSHNAAYRHFADREELLAEIADRGMDLLTEAMEARLASMPDGSRRPGRAQAPAPARWAAPTSSSRSPSRGCSAPRSRPRSTTHRSNPLGSPG